MGMKVCAVRRTSEKTDLNDDYVENVVGFYVLKEMCVKVDYVFVVLLLMEEMDKMINVDVLSVMKDMVVFINVGRGSTVDEDAFVDALRNKKIVGVVLDVFVVELFLSDYLFYIMENVFMSFYCVDLMSDYYDLAFDCFIKYVE